MRLDDVVLDAQYTDIIISLLMPPYNISSITKLIFIAFCVKCENSSVKYNNRTKDFVDVFISNVALKLSAHNDDVHRIIHVIDMLKRTHKVAINQDNIELIHSFSFSTENAFLTFCKSRTPNPIVEINKLEPKALIEEVLRYV